MGNLIFKPATGGVLKLQDAGSTDRITVTDGGTSVLSDEGGTSALSIQADGDIDIAENIYLASGKGIYFDGGTTSTNFLDDYEEGTWTGGVSDGTTALTMNGAMTTGYYTKVGNLVTVSGRFATTSLNGLTNEVIRITGLPFAIPNNTAAWSSGAMGYGEGLNITAGQFVSFFVRIGQSYIDLTLWSATAGTAYMQASEWTADGGVMLGFSYRAV